MIETKGAIFLAGHFWKIKKVTRFVVSCFFDKKVSRFIANLSIFVQYLDVMCLLCLLFFAYMQNKFPSGKKKLKFEKVCMWHHDCVDQWGSCLHQRKQYFGFIFSVMVEHGNPNIKNSKWENAGKSQLKVVFAANIFLVLGHAKNLSC